MAPSSPVQGMAAALGLGKLSKHIKEIPTLSVKDFWRQSDAPAAADGGAPQPVDFDDDQPLSPRSMQVRDEAKQAVLQVSPFTALHDGAARNAGWYCRRLA